MCLKSSNFLVILQVCFLEIIADYSFHSYVLMNVFPENIHGIMENLFVLYEGFEGERLALAPLSEPIMTTSVDYTDVEGNYYLYLSVSRDEIELSSYEVWLINAEVILIIFGGSDDVR